MTSKIPGLNVMAESFADRSEEASVRMILSAMRMFMNIHDKEASRDAIAELLHTEDDEVIEKIRQKLIGMEFAEVMEEFQFMLNQNIPAIIFRADDYDDKIVPHGQIDSKAEELGLSVFVYRGTTHMTPYERTPESADLMIQILHNFRNKKSPESGISAVKTEE